MSCFVKRFTIPVDKITPEGVEFYAELSNHFFKGDVTFKPPIIVSVKVRKAGRGIFVEGRIRVCAILMCDRCLNNIEYPIEKEDFTVFFKNANTDNIDLTEYIREDIILTLPIKFTFRPDASKPCRLCGKGVCTDQISNNTDWNHQMEDLDTYFK